MSHWRNTKDNRQTTELHDGNIAAWKWTAPNATPWTTAAVQEYYRYDPLSRIRQSRRGIGFTNSECLFGYSDGSMTGHPFSTTYLYDKGGNLRSLNRMGSSGLIDKMVYTYTPTIERLDY